MKFFIETLCNFFVVHCPIGSSPNDVVPLFYPSSQNTKITHFPKKLRQTILTNFFQKVYNSTHYLFCSSENRFFSNFLSFYTIYTYADTVGAFQLILTVANHQKASLSYLGNTFSLLVAWKNAIHKDMPQNGYGRFMYLYLLLLLYTYILFSTVTKI